VRVINRRDIIRSVRDKWNMQYGTKGDYKFFDGTTAGSVRKHLAALDLETCSVDDLGLHSSWSNNICDECGGGFEYTVQLGEEPDYDRRWQNLCVTCLENAVALLRGAKA
jgi:hypothetical protein